MSGVVLAEHLRHQADWRDLKAEEWPDDDRNERSANALRAAAVTVTSLPEDDPRLLKMEEANWFVTGEFLPWESGHEIIRRYGFHRGHACTETLLDDLARAAEPELLDI